MSSFIEGEDRHQATLFPESLDEYIAEDSMADPRFVKSWKATEIMLNQAADYLLDPDKFSLPEKDLAEYRNCVRVNELELAMLELEAIAREHGAKSGFWRRLQKAARQMNLYDKVEEYEADFHRALKESND